jgi:hypothetical protein
MKNTIKINGEEFELLGTVRESGGFGIHTKAGTFWMKPCKPMAGQAAFWMGKNGFVVELPGECPQRISRVSFDIPDLTATYLDEVKADYDRYLDYWRTISAEEHAREYGLYFPVREENETKAAYDKREKQWLSEFEDDRNTLLAMSFDDFRKKIGVEQVWSRHRSPKLSLQHGCLVYCH